MGSYNPETKIASYVYQVVRPTGLLSSPDMWLTTPGAIAHPIALLAPVFDEYNYMMLRALSDAARVLGNLETEIGQHNYEDPPGAQAKDMFAMDFADLIRRLNHCNATIAGIITACLQLSQVLTDVSKHLDDDSIDMSGSDFKMTHTQGFRAKVQYWITSQKSLLLQLQHEKNGAQAQLTVVSSNSAFPSR